MPCWAVPCYAMPCRAVAVQVRKFKPKLVAIKDAGKVKQLQELIKDVDQQPEILVGDEGAVEVQFLFCDPNFFHSLPISGFATYD